MPLCMKNKKERRLQMAKKLTTKEEIIVELMKQVKAFAGLLVDEMKVNQRLRQQLNQKIFKEN